MWGCPHRTSSCRCNVQAASERKKTSLRVLQSCKDLMKDLKKMQISRLGVERSKKSHAFVYFSNPFPTIMWKLSGTCLLGFPSRWISSSTSRWEWVRPTTPCGKQKNTRDRIFHMAILVSQSVFCCKKGEIQLMLQTPNHLGCIFNPWQIVRSTTNPKTGALFVGFLNHQQWHFRKPTGFFPCPWHLGSVEKAAKLG